MRAAATMTKSSCHCMEHLGNCGCGCQSPLKQALLKYAPNPKEPENNWMDSTSFHSAKMHIEMPFQDGKKLFHCMSAIALELRWMW